jgi:hypothetical protein
VGGEVLLDRTVRLVREAAPGAGVVIVAFDERYGRSGCERFEPAHGPRDFCDTDKLLSARERWGERGQTVLLWGDVFFTEGAMGTILGYEGPARFFGRREGSYFSGCRWRELFGLSFPAGEQGAVAGVMEAVRGDLLARRVTNGGGWAVYERMFGGRLEGMTVIDDFTEDFDFPGDYERWRRRYESRVWGAAARVWSPVAKGWRWRLHRWGRRLMGKRGVVGFGDGREHV